MELIRLVTVHPALVHFSLGTVPILVLAYGLARARHSEGWTLTGDATLIVTALITLATSTFGLVSFLVLDWPGGLGLWRWLHLILGAVSTVVLAVFAAVRWRARRRSPVSGGGAFAASIGTAALLLATGWIGGEVLVFHAGAAVTAAGDGALAGPTWDDERDDPPADLDEAMTRARADWGAITTTTAEMIVHRPSEDAFAHAAARARSLRSVAAWVATGGRGGEAARARLSPAPRLVAQAGGGGGGASPEAHLAAMGSALESQAENLIERAEAEDLPGLARALGDTSGLCAACHEQLRWNGD